MKTVLKSIQNRISNLIPDNLIKIPYRENGVYKVATYSPEEVRKLIFDFIKANN